MKNKYHQISNKSPNIQKYAGNIRKKKKRNDSEEIHFFPIPLLCLGLLFSAPEQKGAPYWKFAFPDPLGKAEKTLVVVIVVPLREIYSKLEILRIFKPKV